MAAVNTSQSGIKMPEQQCQTLNKIDVGLVLRSLGKMSLASILVGEHLVVINRRFDAAIGANQEPAIAFMVLFNVKTGVFLKRIWNLTVGIGRALEAQQFLDACRLHFSQGKVCPGFLDRETGKLSVACSNILSEGAMCCPECQQFRDGEGHFSIRVGDERMPRSVLLKSQGLAERQNTKVAIKDEYRSDQMKNESTNVELNDAPNGEADSETPEIIPPAMPMPGNVFAMLGNRTEIKVEDNCKSPTLIEEPFAEGGAVAEGAGILNADGEGEEMLGNDQVQAPMTDINTFEHNSEFDEPPRCEEQKADSLEASSRRKRYPVYQKKYGIVSCHLCDLQFTDERAHRAHLKQRHFWGKFRCTLCRVYFTSSQDIVTHMENHERHEDECHYNEPYIYCPNCKDAILVRDFVGHYGQCVLENSQVFECPSCHKAFASSNKLNRHWMRDHVGTVELKNQCNWCDKKFKTNFLNLFFLHAQEKHLFGIFFCSKCPFKANFARDLIEHMDEGSHGDVQIQCPSCKVDFTKMEVEAHYKQCITLHLRSRIRRIRQLDVGPIAKCAECGKIFKHQYKLREHFKTHLRKQDTGQEAMNKLLPGSKKKEINLFHYCDKCDKKFTKLLSLRHHYRSEHDNKEYHCDVCSETFKTYRNLLSHKNVVHSTDKKYDCKFCGKRFGCISFREKHERGHQEPQFQCSICAKRLKSQDKLEAHERAHRGEKPFPCSICGAGFTSLGGLGQHRKGVHKIVGPKGGKGGWIRRGNIGDRKE